MKLSFEAYFETFRAFPSQDYLDDRVTALIDIVQNGLLTVQRIKGIA